MKKLFLSMILLFSIFITASCGPSEEELTRNAYDEVLEERLSKTIEMESIYVILEKYEFVSAYDHPDVYVYGSFTMYYKFDTDIFSKEEIRGYSGTSVRLTLKEEALSLNSYETYIDCMASNLDGSYTKTVRKKIIIPSWEHCVGYIYKGSATNFKNFENKGTEGFYCWQQYITSGHFYTDVIVEMDIPNELIKYEVRKYEKDLYGSYNHKTENGVYYYGEQKVSINGEMLSSINVLTDVETGTIEARMSGLVKRFDRIFNNIGLDKYVSVLTK